MITYIYGLIDSSSHSIFYVGKTNSTLSRRLNSHIDKARKRRTPKERWIDDSLRGGKRPQIVELAKLENPSDEDVAAAEQAWIDFCRIANPKLTNLGVGGQGGSGSHRLEWTAELDAQLGKVPDEVIADQLGCNRKSVAYRREKLGIPRCLQTNFVVPKGKPFEAIELPDSIIAQLGQMPDYQLAKLASVDKSVIRRRRIRLGIPSYAEQTGNTGQYKAGNYPTRWLKQGGDDLSHQE